MLECTELITLLLVAVNGYRVAWGCVAIQMSACLSVCVRVCDNTNAQRKVRQSAKLNNWKDEQNKLHENAKITLIAYYPNVTSTAIQ